MEYSFSTYVIVIATFIGMFLSGVISFLYCRLGWNYGLIALASAYISLNNLLAAYIYTEALFSPGGPSAHVEYTPFMRFLEWAGVLVTNGTALAGFIWAHRFYSLVYLREDQSWLTARQRTFAAFVIPLVLTFVAVLIDLFAPPNKSYVPFSALKDLSFLTIPVTLYFLVATSWSIFTKRQEIKALFSKGAASAISLGVFYRALILFMTFASVTFGFFGNRVNTIYLKPGVVYTDAYESYTNDSLAWKYVLSPIQAFSNIIVFGTAKVLYVQKTNSKGGKTSGSTPSFVLQTKPADV